MTHQPVNDQVHPITVSRNLVQAIIVALDAHDDLAEALCDHDTFVLALAYNELYQYYLPKQITLAMISRWVMEAVSNLGNPYKCKECGGHADVDYRGEWLCAHCACVEDEIIH